MQEKRVPIIYCSRGIFQMAGVSPSQTHGGMDGLGLAGKGKTGGREIEKETKIAILQYKCENMLAILKFNAIL